MPPVACFIILEAYHKEKLRQLIYPSAQTAAQNVNHGAVLLRLWLAAILITLGLIAATFLYLSTWFEIDSEAILVNVICALLFCNLFLEQFLIQRFVRLLFNISQSRALRLAQYITVASLTIFPVSQVLSFADGLTLSALLFVFVKIFDASSNQPFGLLSLRHTTLVLLSVSLFFQSAN